MPLQTTASSRVLSPRLRRILTSSYRPSSFVVRMPPSPIAERLERVEAEATGRAERPDHRPVVGRGDGLGGVLDDVDLVSLGDPHDGVHLRRAVRWTGITAFVREVIARSKQAESML